MVLTSETAPGQLSSGLGNRLPRPLQALAVAMLPWRQFAQGRQGTSGAWPAALTVAACNWSCAWRNMIYASLTADTAETTSWVNGKATGDALEVVPLNIPRGVPAGEHRWQEPAGVCGQNWYQVVRAGPA